MGAVWSFALAVVDEVDGGVAGEAGVGEGAGGEGGAELAEGGEVDSAEAEAVDAGAGDGAAGGVALEGGAVGVLHEAVDVAEALGEGEAFGGEGVLDAAAAEIGGDVEGVEVAAAGPGVEVVANLFNPEGSGAEHAHADGNIGAVLSKKGDDALCAFAELVLAPGLVEALFAGDGEQVREVRVRGRFDAGRVDVGDRDFERRVSVEVLGEVVVGFEDRREAGEAVCE